MEIKTLELSGFKSALEALRLPYSLNPRSDIDFSWKGVAKNIVNYTVNGRIDDEDLYLMSVLVKRGDEHAKVLRGIIVYAKITAPLYFFNEEETYRAGHERLSSESTMHTEGKGLSGEELQKVKAAIPCGREITKIDYFSYQTLRRIYFQRRNHRLPEWKTFIDWINTLPYSKELITIE